MEQETPHLLGEPGQHLRAEIVDDMTVVARERLDESCALARPRMVSVAR